MSTLSATFNDSGFGHWINSPAGRAFRLVAGLGFLTVGVLSRDSSWGKASVAWSVFPLSAGAADICWVSAALGGPLRGGDCRRQAADG